MTQETRTSPAAPPDQGGWKATILAGLANYIDAGSIVAGAAALALWVKIYNLSPTFVGLIGAFSASAISAGVGALVGGRLCDLYGRKKIYQYDMLFYAFGMLWLVFAVQPWMIVVGFILVGLAVGADIPASWSLIAEIAPTGERGKHSGVAQILWNLGPVVVLGLFLVLEPFGILGARLVFAHLAILAVVLTLFRSKMAESQVWIDAQKSPKTVASGSAAWRELLQPRHLKSLSFLVIMYGMWNLWAGTSGFYLPYILQTVGNQSRTVSVAVNAYGFVVNMLSTALIFMPLSDRINQRLLFGCSAVINVGGMMLLAVLPMTLPVALAYVTLLAFASGFGAQAFFQLWSSELFPTLIRSTAQGVSFAVVRIVSGVFSFFVPVLTATGFHTLAWILTGFLFVSGAVGLIFAPRNEGKSLAQIQLDQENAR